VRACSHAPVRWLRAGRRAGLGVAALLIAACAPGADPPGRTASSSGAPRLPLPNTEPTVVEASDAPPPESLEPGGGDKIASIAMRTWIYDAPRPRSQKLGYLRAGAVVDRSSASFGTAGCEGGWYRIAPRGYVCVGKGASLSIDHPIVQAAPRGPDRKGATPYAYAISRSPPPHLYFRLPSEADQRRVEGATYRTHVRERLADFPGLDLDPVPRFLAEGHSLPKIYGSEKNLAFSVHTGRARDNSAFGLISIFDHTGRRFALTTELDIIPLDRTKAATVGAPLGIVLTKGGAPGFASAAGAPVFEMVGPRQREVGTLKGRQAVELSGNEKGGLVETVDGTWVPEASLTIANVRKDRSGHAERGRKWISISIEKQLLVAYEGEKPVFATLVSSGRGGMGDPEETLATIRGSFYVRAKHVSGTMDGDQGSEEAFDLRDVPSIQYFHEGYALHGAYWHDDFGRPRSHGCINLAPGDAAWLFAWTDPQVPLEWHGAVSPQGGTLIEIRK
jgi:lipoprotein-anchoring transpeptidase ErfK/SrfK